MMKFTTLVGMLMLLLFTADAHAIVVGEITVVTTTVEGEPGTDYQPGDDLFVYAEATVESDVTDTERLIYLLVSIFPGDGPAAIARPPHRFCIRSRELV